MPNRFPTIRRSRNKLLVFARVPQRAAVKSRLSAVLGEDRALSLYEAMVQDLLEAIGKADETLDIEVFWSGEAPVDGELLRRVFEGYRLSRQTGRDLGERLVVAFSEKIAFHDAEKVIAIGTDLPTLDRRCVMRAFQLLDSCDWVLGPAADGGYFLIGLRSGSFHPLVFEKIDWGESSVLETTLSRIRSLGTTVALLPEQFDLDRKEDLSRFAELEEARGTRVARLLAEWGYCSG